MTSPYTFVFWTQNGWSYAFALKIGDLNEKAEEEEKASSHHRALSVHISWSWLATRSRLGRTSLLIYKCGRMHRSDAEAGESLF